MLSLAGAKRFLELSDNENVKANREELFDLLKQAQKKLMAKAKTSTAGASAPSKKRSHHDDGDEDGASFESDEEPDDLDSQAQKVTKFAKSMAGAMTSMREYKADADALTVSCTAAGAAYVALADGKRMVLDLAPREEEAARARLETQRREDALKIETLCKVCELEAARLKAQSEADNHKLAMQRAADEMAASYKERELAAQREADALKLTAQREADALKLTAQREADAMEAARLEQKLAYEIKMSELKDKELAREKERLALESQKASPAPPPADTDTGLITVRGVANKHNMLDKVVKDKRESVLSKAGARIASDYRDKYGSDLHSVKEGKFTVHAYPQDNEEIMLHLIQLEVTNATAPIGKLTIDTFRVLVKRFKSKKLQDKILNDAESTVIGKMLEGGSTLMGTIGDRQTFAEGYHNMLYDAVTSAIRNYEDSIDKSKSRPINQFFSAPAARNSNLNA